MEDANTVAGAPTDYPAIRALGGWLPDEEQDTRHRMGAIATLDLRRTMPPVSQAVPRTNCPAIEGLDLRRAAPPGPDMHDPRLLVDGRWF